MIKIYIPELEKHRNETTFRPYLMCSDYFRDIGVHFTTSGNSFDICWIGQASYTDKTISLQESIEKGLQFLHSIGGEQWLFDGQDSASLIGSYDVFVNSSAKYLFKNSLYVDKNDYTLPWINGRSYWGMGIDGWKITDFSRFIDVRLSGTNWLSTVPFQQMRYKNVEKPIDVFAVFSYPAKENWEYTVKTSNDYSMHRSRCIGYLKSLPRKYNVAMLKNGEHYSRDEYYKLMSSSKIIIAPFGYGEMAPRDLESAMVGSILIKPDMGHIQSIPNIYLGGDTYIPVKWNFEDMNQKIERTLSEFPKFQEYYVENMRSKYVEEYSPRKLVEYIYNILKNEPNIISEE